MVRTWIFCGLMMTTLAIAAQSPSKNNCDPKQNKNCVPQPSAPASTSQPTEMPGADADVPGEEPAAQPKKPDTSMPGTDSDVPGEAPSAPAKQHAPLPDMPTGGNEPEPPASSNTPQPSNVPQQESSSSAQPDQFSSSSDPEAKDTPAPTTQDDDTPVKAAPLKNLGAKDDFSKIHEKLDETRVEDDLKVAKFYASDGNWQGAYLRYKDATEHDAEDEDALWGLAQSEEKLKKIDEARAHYDAYLKLAPDGDHVKEAKAALARLPKKNAATPAKK